MFPYKKKIISATPICVHDWNLLNVYTHTDQFSTDKIYTVGCSKCNQVQNMDEHAFANFTEEFDVKNRKGNQ